VHLTYHSLLCVINHLERRSSVNFLSGPKSIHSRDKKFEFSIRVIIFLAPFLIRAIAKWNCILSCVVGCRYNIKCQQHLLLSERISLHNACSSSSILLSSSFGGFSYTEAVYINLSSTHSQRKSGERRERERRMDGWMKKRSKQAVCNIIWMRNSVAEFLMLCILFCVVIRRERDAREGKN
jgi:hypothetical protein